jgi:tRNA (cytidine/uridine-2'-O-)-methyltransferase
MFHIVLVEPEIPPNTGNVARLCAANNLQLHLVKPLGFDIDDRAVRRAGLDYWDQVKLSVHENMDELWKTIDSRPVYFFTTKAQKTLFEAQFERDSFLIFGKETTGLPEKFVLEHMSDCYRIPQVNPRVRSLNLSTAVGIVAYEAIRQLAIK